MEKYLHCCTFILKHEYNSSNFKKLLKDIDQILYLVILLLKCGNT